MSDGSAYSPKYCAQCVNLIGPDFWFCPSFSVTWFRTWQKRQLWRVDRQSRRGLIYFVFGAVHYITQNTVYYRVDILLGNIKSSLYVSSILIPAGLNALLCAFSYELCRRRAVINICPAANRDLSVWQQWVVHEQETNELSNSPLSRMKFPLELKRSRTTGIFILFYFAVRNYCAPKMRHAGFISA